MVDPKLLLYLKPPFGHQGNDVTQWILFHCSECQEHVPYNIQDIPSKTEHTLQDVTDVITPEDQWVGRQHCQWGLCWPQSLPLVVAGLLAKYALFLNYEIFHMYRRV